MNNTKRTPTKPNTRATAPLTAKLLAIPAHEIAEPADRHNNKRKSDHIDPINPGESSDAKRKAMGENMKELFEKMSQNINLNMTQTINTFSQVVKKDMKSMSQDLKQDMKKDSQDLKLELKQDMGTVCAKVDRVQRKIDDVEQKVDEMRGKITQQIDHLHEKLAATNDQVSKNSDDVTNINWKLNELEQMNLAARMDITGVEEEQVTGDIKSVAISIIRNCGITTIEPADIVAAFARKPKGYDNPIITAIFASAERKSEIMRSKLANKTPTTIYFGHTMTPATRIIFRRAKIMAKHVGAKTVYVSSGKVVVAFDGGRKIWISSADIAGYELPLPERREVEPVTDTEDMLM